MMKNALKLIIAITLATVFGMSVCMEPAAAKKRKGNRYSKTGEDGASIVQQFSLVDSTWKGFSITEDNSTKNDPNLGLFVSAIENYRNGYGRFCTEINIDKSNYPDFFEERCSDSAGRNFRDSTGYPIFWQPFTATTSQVNGNLKAEFFQAGTDPFFGITQDGESGYDVIAYSIFKEGEAEPALNFRLSVDNLLKLDPSNDRKAMIDLAVNDLAYILNNNLLGLEETIAVAPIQNPIGQPGYVYSGKAVLQNQVEQDIPDVLQNQVEQDIPEPDTTIASLLALGVLSAGTLLKRKVQQR